MRREALLALARTDSAALRKALPPFAGANDWRERASPRKPPPSRSRSMGPNRSWPIMTTAW